MGCISSKFVRSLSLREDQNQSLQRSATRNSTFDEMTINDQLLALVCTANTVASKLRSRSFSNKSLKPAMDSTATLTNNTWEFISSLENGLEKGAEPASPALVSQPASADLAMHSKSCHWFPESEVPSHSDGTKEENGGNHGIERARSFHTVEEYDALIEKILSSARQMESNGENDGSTTKVPSPATHNSNNHSILETQQAQSNKEASPEVDGNIENQNHCNTTKELNIIEDLPKGRTLDKGYKRKSIAKGLESLQIPQTIEFPAIASLREWMHAGGQVGSPGSYVTPRFGTSALTVSGSAKECNESEAFNPEMVAVLEESMQQLEAEAASILKQMGQKSEEACSMEKQAGEVSLNTKD